jgi:hypothetical protein
MTSPRRRSTITVSLSDFSFEAVARGEGEDSARVRSRLVRAVRVYLNARGSDRPGWAVPAALRAGEGDDVELELDADEAIWRALREEAGRQGVSVSRLVGQAAIYYAAELDAGRLTQSILDELGAEDAP